MSEHKEITSYKQRIVYRQLRDLDLKNGMDRGLAELATHLVKDHHLGGHDQAIYLR